MAGRPFRKGIGALLRSELLARRWDDCAFDHAQEVFFQAFSIGLRSCDETSFNFWFQV
jgi:hypothetical protein